MIDAKKLYDAHADASLQFTNKRLPLWSQLSWPERDFWQAQADELNEARD